MARPCCPLCQDAFSVAKVSAIARSDLLPLAARWQPPAAPGALGRYMLMALIGAAGLYLLTGFTLLCPALVLCSGVIVKLVISWEREDEAAAYRHARACWQAAYYCSTHDTVFLPGEQVIGSPARFALLIETWATGQSAPRRAPRVRPAAGAPLSQREPAVCQGGQQAPLPEAGADHRLLEAA
jgi:hypothetical protein